jgi:HEAT repeat protein
MTVAWLRSGAVLAAALLLATVPPNAQPSDERSHGVADQTITDRVEAAFAAARSGDLAPSGALQDIGPDIIPALVPYLDDANEDVRRQAVTLLDLTESPEAVPHLAAALSDPSYDVARRAAIALYEMAPEALRDPSVAPALRSAVRHGDDAGAAILLLGRVPGAESIAALNELRGETDGQTTQVFHWSPEVPVPFAADVALTRLGDPGAKARVLAAIGSGDFEVLSFLLEALRDVEDRDVLSALADATLSDLRPTSGDAPSSADLGIRLADVAAARFVKRFGLSVGVDTTADEPLSEAQLDAVHEAVDERLGG